MAIEAALFGTLGRDGELKTSKAGRQYLRLNVRVGDGDGAQWVSVMAFDEKAVEVAEQMVKGARVYAEGSLRLDQWEQQDGTKRAGLSLISWHCRLAAIGQNKPKRERDVGEQPKATASAAANNFHDDDIPF